MCFGEVWGSGGNVFYIENSSADTIRGTFSKEHEAASTFFRFKKKSE